MRELKVGIVGGVLSSILVIIFIQPLLHWIWDAVLSFGAAIHAGYIDRLYRNAAVGDRGLPAFFTLLMLINLMLLVAASLLLPLVLRGLKELHQEVINLLLCVGVLCCVAMAPVVLVGAAVSVGVNELGASFRQRVTVLAPAISDREYKEWQARWASMKGQGDYSALVTAMETRAVELQVALPPLRRASAAE